MKLLYGTTNLGKLMTMRKRLLPLGIELDGLRDLCCPLPDVREDGQTPLDNAREKATAYYRAFHRPVFSCDSGLYFENVPDSVQPGLNVRRVNGKSLTDEEMIAYYSSLAKAYGGRLGARYQNAICLVMDETHCFESMDDSLSGERFVLIDTPHPTRKPKPGYPLDCLSVRVEDGRYFYDDVTADANDNMEMDDGFQAFFRKSLGLSGNQKSRREARQP